MSGEAGATLQSAMYSIFIGTGFRKICDRETAAEYFAEASAPYREWLKRARPALDALFPGLVAAGIPLAPYQEARATRLEGPDRLEGSLEVLVTASEPLTPDQSDAILDRIAEVLRSYQMER